MWKLCIFPRKETEHCRQLYTLCLVYMFCYRHHVIDLQTQTLRVPERSRQERGGEGAFTSILSNLARSEQSLMSPYVQHAPWHVTSICIAWRNGASWQVWSQLVNVNLCSFIVSLLTLAFFLAFSLSLRLEAWLALQCSHRFKVECCMLLAQLWSQLLMMFRKVTGPWPYCQLSNFQSCWLNLWCRLHFNVSTWDMGNWMLPLAIHW